MNPHSATVRATDLTTILRCHIRSVWRWLSPDYPPHIAYGRSPRVYSLVDLVQRLRARRVAGLTGRDLDALATFDAHVRTARTSDDLWLGDAPEGRAAAFLACLEGEEVERAREVQKRVRNAAVAGGLTGIHRLAKIAIIQPGVVRFILSDDRAELPINESGWGSFTRALWALNPTEMKEAA